MRETEVYHHGFSGPVGVPTIPQARLFGDTCLRDMGKELLTKSRDIVAPGQELDPSALAEAQHFKA